MCEIAGIINFKKNLFAYEAYNRLLVRDMVCGVSDENSSFSSEWVGEHSAFSVTLPDNTKRIIKKTVEGYEFIIACYSNTDNLCELKNELTKFGYDFTTNSDTEILLYTYIHYGEECCKKLNGKYSFCIWDSMRQQIFICRSKQDTHQFFYATSGNTIMFSSSVKSLFRYPNFTPKLDKTGLCELLTYYPFKIENSSILKDVYELNPLSYMIINRCGISKRKYMDCTNTLPKEYDFSYFNTRINLFKPIIKETLNLEEYLKTTYENMTNFVPNHFNFVFLDEIIDEKNSPINVFIDRKNTLKSPKHLCSLVKINEFFNEFKPSII